MASITQQDPENHRFLYGSELQEGYIRLIRLLPSKDASEVVKCSLFEVSLINALKWEALSYTWGDEYNEKTILINDIETPIRKNLWEALYHLRETAERVLWIDAICINQQNILERNHQVKQMKLIYNSASRVIVWLGVRSDDSDLAMEFITAAGLGSKFDQSALSHGYKPWQNFLQDHTGSVYGSSKKYLFDGEPFLNTKFCERDDEPLKGYLPVFWLDEIRNTYQKGGSRLRILLEMSENAICSDVRDKVYGLVGIANDAADLVIDYSKSPFDLFIDLLLRQQKDISQERVLPESRFLQRLLLGKVETPPTDSQWASQVSVVAKVYDAGTISFLRPIPDWHSLEFQMPYTMKQLQEMKLKADNPSIVAPIYSNIAYAVKNSKADQSSLKTDKNTSPPTRSSDPEPLLLITQTGRIAIAPGNTLLSDTICRTEIGPSGSLVILRKKSDRYLVVGRALFPDIWSERWKEKEPDHMNLHLDVRTLQLLTKPDQFVGGDMYWG